jgi:hypothetical protein
MKLQTIIQYTFICLLTLPALLSCNIDSYYQNSDADNIINEKVDNLFLNGFDMNLEQIYVMSSKNTIPYIDRPIDSCFKSKINTVNISNFIHYGPDDLIHTNDDNNVLTCLTKNENWNISKLLAYYDTTYVEHGFGDNYFLTTNISEHTYNLIKCTNQYTYREYIIPFRIGDIYVHRGHDNHVFNVFCVDIKNNNSYRSSLYMEILTDENGIGVHHNGKYIYFDTNYQYKVSYQVTTPLTSNEVKNEIANGNYTLYLWNGMTTFKIGNNLYITRYNSYVYVGEVNANGSIMNFEQRYYRLKFKIK